MVRDASKKVQEELDKDETLANTNSDSLDNYKDFGAGAMTTLFKSTGMVADWKVKLNKLFRMALGQRVFMNPDMINKRIEDAPPGREDIESTMIKVGILLDCSSSMGGSAFKKVITQMDAMIRADKGMKKVQFYIMPFSEWSVEESIKLMKRCKGTQLKQTLLTFGPKGSTYITNAVEALMRKIKNPDTVIVMSDCEIWDDDAFARNSYCKKLVTKFRKRLIWVMPSKSGLGYMAKFDKFAKKEDRYLVFKGDGD